MYEWGVFGDTFLDSKGSFGFSLGWKKQFPKKKADSLLIK